MLERSRARKAFDHCAVRAIASQPEGSLHTVMVCPKYPEGFKATNFAMGYDDDRAKLALTLGCLTCPYRKVDLPPGESAIQAIRRISDQSTIDKLNNLLEEQPPELSQEPDQQ
jgi:hypothetical protein